MLVSGGAGFELRQPNAVVVLRPHMCVCVHVCPWALGELRASSRASVGVWGKYPLCETIDLPNIASWGWEGHMDECTWNPYAVCMVGGGGRRCSFTHPCVRGGWVEKTDCGDLPQGSRVLPLVPAPVLISFTGRER